MKYLFLIAVCKLVYSLTYSLIVYLLPLLHGDSVRWQVNFKLQHVFDVVMWFVHQQYRTAISLLVVVIYSN